MAEEEVLVLDASVAVKWFNQEPLRGKALALRQSSLEGRVEPDAPSPMIYEVANALRYNPRYGSDEVKYSVEALENLQVTIQRFEGSLASSAVEIAYTADAEVVARASTDSGASLGIRRGWQVEAGVQGATEGRTARRPEAPN